jgi:DNA-binding winged helix-turn-helix (wHTH) protein
MRLQFDELAFDPETRQLWVRDQETHLSPKAFDLLALLIERRPRAVSKAEIRQFLWPGTFVSESSLHSLVSEVRDAIGDHDRRRRFIRTLHARGYSFQAPEPTANRALAAEKPTGWLIGSVGEIALAAGENVLGREGPGVILLKSSTVSRRHVRLVIDSDKAVIEDLGSKNGTYVNDRRVSSPTSVAEGDEIRIGSLLFTFRAAQRDRSTDTMSSRPRGC